MDLKKQRVRVDLDLPSNAMSLRLKAVCEGSHADGSRTARSSKEFKREGVNGKGLGGGDARGRGSGDEAARNVEGSKRGGKGGARNCGNDDGADGVPRVRASVRWQCAQSSGWLLRSACCAEMCIYIYKRVGVAGILRNADQKLQYFSTE